MSQQHREFTGLHMLLLMLGFFGVVIGVNVALAVLAAESWTGFVVKNSYVASQEFNERSAEGRAQTALGWTGELAIGPNGIRYRLLDADGHIVRLGGVSVYMHRPTSAAEDRKIELAMAGGGAFAAETGKFADGVWIIEITADAGRPHPWRDVRRILLRDGALK